LVEAQKKDILSALIQKELVQECIRNNVKHFSCSPPACLLSIVDAREDEVSRQKETLKKMIPELQKLQNAIASRSNARIFHGSEGIKQIFEDMLQYPGETIYGAVDVADSMTFAQGEGCEWLDRFVRRRADLGIWWLGIMNLSAESERALATWKWLNRRVRTITGLDLTAEINICGPKVVFTSTHTEAVGFVLENENIAESFRNIHHAIWATLSEYEPQEDEKISSAAGVGKERLANGG
jgi:sugar-specific transcriptional regulator TrmB